MQWAHRNAKLHPFMLMTVITIVLRKWSQQCLKIIVRTVGEGHPHQGKTVGVLSPHHILVFKTRLASSICVEIIRAVLFNCLVTEVTNMCSNSLLHPEVGF
jgi:hypothetical protein